MKTKLFDELNEMNRLDITVHSNSFTQNTITIFEFSIWIFVWFRFLDKC